MIDQQCCRLHLFYSFLHSFWFSPASSSSSPSPSCSFQYALFLYNLLLFGSLTHSVHSKTHIHWKFYYCKLQCWFFSSFSHRCAIIDDALLLVVFLLVVVVTFSIFSILFPHHFFIIIFFFFSFLFFWLTSFSSHPLPIFILFIFIFTHISAHTFKASCLAFHVSISLYFTLFRFCYLLFRLNPVVGSNTYSR